MYRRGNKLYVYVHTRRGIGQIERREAIIQIDGTCNEAGSSRAGASVYCLF